MSEQDYIEYQKGFNEGYLLTKHLPELAGSIAKIESPSPRIEGFRDGRKEFALETVRDRRPSFLKQQPPEQNTPSKDRDRDLER